MVWKLQTTSTKSEFPLGSCFLDILVSRTHELCCQQTAQVVSHELSQNVRATMGYGMQRSFFKSTS